MTGFIIVLGVHLSCAVVLVVWMSLENRKPVPDTVPLPVRTPGQALFADGFGGRDTDSVSETVWLVLSVSQDSPGLSELSRRTGCPEQSVSQALAWMQDSGAVVQDGDGYQLRLADRDPV